MLEVFGDPVVPDHPDPPDRDIADQEDEEDQPVSVEQAFVQAKGSNASDCLKEKKKGKQVYFLTIGSESPNAVFQNQFPGDNWFFQFSINIFNQSKTVESILPLA